MSDELLIFAVIGVGLVWLCLEIVSRRWKPPMD